MAGHKFFDFTEEASSELKSFLRDQGSVIACEPGKLLIREGFLHDCVIIVLDGEISVSTTDHQGNQQFLATLGEGAVVGEMSWLEGRPAVADVVTKSSGSVLELSFSLLDNISHSHPVMAAEWQQLIARKLADQIKSQNAWIHRYEGPGEEIEPMRKVLVLFAELDEQDINILGSIGSLRRIKPGNILIQQGSLVLSIYLILAGQAEIFVEIDGVNKKVGSSRRGELLGELTLLGNENQGATATVQSAGGMELLELKKIELKQVLQDNSKFAARFYRSLSCMLSQRSRDQLFARQLAKRSQVAEGESNDAGEIDLTSLSGINRAGQHFNTLCQKFQSNGGNQS